METEMEIVNRKGATFTDQVGIPRDRVEQLAQQMDDLVKSYGTQRTLMCDVFNDILRMCTNIKEYTFCVASHTCWLASKGYYLVPPEKKREG